MTILHWLQLDMKVLNGPYWTEEWWGLYGYYVALHDEVVPIWVKQEREREIES